MKFGVIVFPGSNCDHDVYSVLKDTFKQETVKLWHKNTDLEGCDFIVVPGGFSYGDYLRSGAIARFSPIMNEVIKHAENGGYVLGICNGFQILTEAHLLPGALLRNNNQKFNCKNVFLQATTQNSLLTQNTDPAKAYKIPIAHAEGRYYASDADLNALIANDQILFRYCDENSRVTEDSCPNGSAMNIAGICNKERNVFGMMPHPERAADDILGNIDGRVIFESILQLVGQV
ncbi:phosphoribosylformylglycinamidine synthase subunit I [Bernardetia litoralis DSM 6794]|uniref:Phosphoribosylformylglycinamidine synthase subunit PurQ n=1 Tax=Bernardetia litoralis (strain ATCC 23117 / DSM 6794 / NBRC 15988 / NCIMB 1366 / Fx l1 / Sio-4) TaxID=880071 RepID=I4AF04_BERLS|nr:phosphoribosylformylglycinamidine synthase subunit PurQ [Bernardetia litoralis]AFM02539.1 phosphoribosylformylglycinamidine synthase subunit I [Bernardetia litoralis DSM 6794]